MALVVSVGLHALMFRLVENGSQTDFHVLPTASPPTTIHITIAHPVTNRIDTTTQISPPSPADRKKMTESLKHTQQTQDREEQTDTHPISEWKSNDKTATRSTREIESQTAPISTAKIIITAMEVAREIAGEDANDYKKDSDSIASKLDNAWNKPRKAPGVSMLSDGTTRVVTEYGVTYCIKPKSDLRINRPEDDINVSVLCK
ncbi:MAG: hypothetical protein KZQ76_13870 [Candidatus Thiodiazotropha sp. (ex Epidulcina cf. delphinae)]|nr:hypothetical protein [Candidatus Thiodiazotropha sp. (ex Epidulcina cf. delphinae)]